MGQTPWVNALKEVRKYLARKDIQYRIELVDFQMANPRTHAILPNNPIVSSWEDVYRPRVLSAIQGADWQTVDVFHRGYSHERIDCPVALIITAWDAEDSLWWESLIPNLQRIWPHAIELRSANNICAMDLDVEASARILTDTAVRGPIQMGASIGIKGERGGGTLGDCATGVA
ncbi:hypothetical protein VTN96DRAFT_342 [Rasamsonia emersonii]